MRAGSEPQELVMRLGTDSRLDDLHSLSLVTMKSIIETRTQGRLRVDILCEGADERAVDMNRRVRDGSLDGAMADLGDVSSDAPSAGIFSVPFLFRDVQHAVAAARGAIGDRVKAEIEAVYACEVLGWGADGVRCVWNAARAVEQASDMTGLRMRVQANALHRATFEALGAVAVPSDFTELRALLQAGAADGADVSVADIASQGLEPFARHLTLTRHLVIMDAIVFSRRFLMSLRPDDRALVREAARTAEGIQIAAVIDQEAALLKALAATGAKIAAPDDLSSFRDALGGLKAMAAQELGADLISLADRSAAQSSGGFPLSSILRNTA